MKKRIRSPLRGSSFYLEPRLSLSSFLFSHTTALVSTTTPYPGDTPLPPVPPPIVPAGPVGPACV